MDSDSLLPQLHPRYSEEETQPVVEAPKKKNSSQERSPDSRALYSQFCEQFKEVHGYQYAGNFFRDTGNLQIFLKKAGIDFDTVSAMIDYIFKEKRGYWKSDIATINTLCYNQSMNSILDVVRKREKVVDDPNRKSRFGTL